MHCKGVNMSKKMVLGLDIGITSVGYCLVELDDENFDGKIIDIGTRIFQAPEDPQTGASLAAPRRENKSARRRLRRRSSRLYEIRKMLSDKKFITQQEIENVYNNKEKVIDVWDLRKQALSRKLTNIELYRILIQIAKRRGFKSVRKSEELAKEGELLKAINNNLSDFEKENFLTIGEMYATKFVGNEAKRNKDGKYFRAIPRSLLEKEIAVIFEKQRDLGSEIATKDIEDEYNSIAFYQTPLQSMEKTIKYCIFEPQYKRAPKCAYHSELFTATTKLLNLSIQNDLGDRRFLDEYEIQQLIELAHKNAKVTYKQAKKSLILEENYKFVALNYNKKGKDGNLLDPETATLIELKNYHAIKKCVGNEKFERIKNNKGMLDNIAIALTYEKSDETITKKMRELKVDEDIIDDVKNLTMSKTMHLSLTAIRKLLPYMLQGKKYHEACEEAGYNHSVISSDKEKPNLLPVLNIKEMTTNPVVNKAVSQTRKVVNALIRKHHKFDSIVIEMARDLSKSFKERKDIEKAQQEFQQAKEKAKERCLELGINPDYPKSNLLKFRLWEEQDGYCIYSGDYLDPKKLADDNYVEIDHIIPYSRSFDDSLNNKVLCKVKQNQEKGNKIPYEFLGGDENKWHELVERAKSMKNLKTAKLNRLTRKSYTSEGFKSRNLNDTRYIAKFVKDYIKENLDFDNNLKVETRNGSLTAFLRTQWGLVKNREENDRHHALDAAVLACSTQGMVKYLSTYSSQMENYGFINSKKPRIKKPWENFREDVIFSVAKIFVSRALRAKATGAIHDATIRSKKHIQEGFTTVKTSLSNIKLETLEKMYDKERNIVIYNILKERLEQFNNDPKKAFAEPVYMPLSPEKIAKGQKAPEIKSIKIKDSSVSGVFVRDGFAKNTSMVRVDVFKKKNKKGKYENFLVPIYIADMGKDLPNKAISQGNKDIYIDDSYDFCFSLYPDTLISINSTGKPEDEKMWYYQSCDSSNGRIKVDSPDGSIKDLRFSTKSLFSIKKYQVGILGDYHEVKHEKRNGLKGKKNNNGV